MNISGNCFAGSESESTGHVTVCKHREKRWGFGLLYKLGRGKGGPKRVRGWQAVSPEKDGGQR